MLSVDSWHDSWHDDVDPELGSGVTLLQHVSCRCWLWVTSAGEELVTNNDHASLQSCTCLSLSSDNLCIGLLLVWYG